MLSSLAQSNLSSIKFPSFFKNLLPPNFSRYFKPFQNLPGPDLGLELQVTSITVRVKLGNPQHALEEIPQNIADNFVRGFSQIHLLTWQTPRGGLKQLYTHHSTGYPLVPVSITPITCLS